VATNGPTVHPSDDIKAWKPGGIILSGKTEELRKNLPVPL
jgi:hypothetical protein